MTVTDTRPTDLAASERSALERSERGKILAVASGKGGVGKTWFSITLAHAFARTGRRALLFDGDIGLANVDIQLGLVPQSDLGSVIAGRASLDDTILRHEGGFDVLPGRSGSGSLAALSTEALEGVIAAFIQAASRYDAVILDLGSGVDAAVRRLAAISDLLLVVATEDPTSLTDAYAVLKLYDQDRKALGPANVRIVVNQASSTAAGARVYATLGRACERFLGRSPQLAGVIRRDERVRDAIRRQTLLLQRHPTSPAAADVEAIAAGIRTVR
jgi:flagellar biosynthesis protein FlhG